MKQLSPQQKEMIEKLDRTINRTALEIKREAEAANPGSFSCEKRISFTNDEMKILEHLAKNDSVRKYFLIGDKTQFATTLITDGLRIPIEAKLATYPSFRELTSSYLTSSSRYTNDGKEITIAASLKKSDKGYVIR